MKPLPNINDEPAMLLKGKRSALSSARNDATEALRDALTAVNSADWRELYAKAGDAQDAAERLMTIAAMWGELE